MYIYIYIFNLTHPHTTHTFNSIMWRSSRLNFTQVCQDSQTVRVETHLGLKITQDCQPVAFQEIQDPLNSLKYLDYCIPTINRKRLSR